MNTRIIALVRVITEMDIFGRGLTNVISVYTYLFSYARCKGTMKYEIIVAIVVQFIPLLFGEKGKRHGMKFSNVSITFLRNFIF